MGYINKQEHINHIKIYTYQIKRRREHERRNCKNQREFHKRDGKL